MMLQFGIPVPATTAILQPKVASGS